MSSPFIKPLSEWIGKSIANGLLFAVIQVGIGYALIDVTIRFHKKIPEEERKNVSVVLLILGIFLITSGIAFLFLVLSKYFKAQNWI